ncbi:MAG: SDR family NAD(P)-dependent oxidoreductase [Acidimicrobiales bacterium]
MSGAARLVALVVGAATPDGRAALADLARPGACLGLAGADADDLAPLVLAAHDAGARATLLPGDLASAGMAERVVDAMRNAFGRIDLVVIVADARPVDPLGAESGRRALERAAVVPFLVLREAGRLMAGAGGGRVVLVEPPGAPVSVAGLVRASGLEVTVAERWPAGAC